jgi:hypothetical protein
MDEGRNGVPGSENQKKETRLKSSLLVFVLGLVVQAAILGLSVQGRANDSFLADLGIKFTNAPANVGAGDTIIYTLTISNTGSFPVTIFGTVEGGVVQAITPTPQGLNIDDVGFAATYTNTLSSTATRPITITVSTQASGVITITLNNTVVVTTTVSGPVSVSERINDFLILDNLATSYAPGDWRAREGVFTIEATFTNISASSFFDVFFDVVTLTGGNEVQNADGGPGGAGAMVSVVLTDTTQTQQATQGNGDPSLDPGESFTVDFEIGLQTRQRFTFFVDAFGSIQ